MDPRRTEQARGEQLRRVLPLPLTPFLGREGELADVERVVLGSRTVTLTGPGGCGKTRMAIEAAGRVAQHFPGGVFWIPLDTLDDPERLPFFVNDTIGLRHDHGQHPIDRLAGYLGDSASLLVLDNCEHLLQAAGELVARLLSATPTASVLATSREALSVPGEQVWPVPPMSLPEGVVDVDAAERSDAIRLFVVRAERALPSFVLDATSAALVAAICVRLDGLPLAIELAAAQAGVMSLAEIHEALDDQLRLLTHGARTTERHATLEASVAWSYTLLDARHQTLLRRLAVFAGSFDAGAARPVAADDALPEDDIVGLLGDLVRKSLLVADTSGAATRYRMLDTIREFGAARLREAAEEGAVRTRHLAHYGGVVAAAAAGAERADPSALDVLDLERANVDRALEWAIGTGDDRAALSMAWDLAPYWLARSHYATGTAWLTRVLDSTRHDSGWARVAAALANLRLPAMDLAGGFGMLDAARAAEVAAAVGDPVAAVRAQLHQGLVESFLGAPDGHLKLAAAAEAAAEAGDQWAHVTGRAYAALMLCLFADDRVGAAEALEPLAAAVERQNKTAEFVVDLVVGHTALRGGELGVADRHLAQAVAVTHEVGDAAMEMFAADGLVEVHELRGEAGAIRELVATSADHMRRSAPGRAEVFSSHTAVALLLDGDAPQARLVLERVETPVRQYGGPWFTTRWLLRTGHAALATGHTDAATAAFEEAIAVTSAQSLPWLRLLALHGGALAARQQGDLATSEALHHETLAVAVERRSLPVAVVALEALGGLAVAGEEPTEGARLLGAAARARAQMGLVGLAWSREMARRDTDAAAELLGDDAFTTAWTEGEDLGFTEAVAYARRARGERRRPSSGWASLTPTEQQVAGLVANGLTNPQIAAAMFVAPSTVKTHLSNVFTKLDVSSRAEVAAEAIRHTG